jgi:Tol biopolymer transport system component
MPGRRFPKPRWIYVRSEGAGDWPSFSPDGKFVVFVIADAGAYSLYRIDAHDGGRLTKIYPQAGEQGNGSRPDWSWNESSIAFTQQTNIGANAGEIWTVSPDGDAPAPYNASLSASLGLMYPSWSKDCQSLVAVGYTSGPEGVQASLYEVTPSGNAQMTRSPNPVAGRPSTSPNGPVAFAGNQGEFSQWSNQIWVVDPRTGEPPQRIEKGRDLSAIQGRSPNWSPLGDLILFESTRYNPDPRPGSPLALWIMNSDGTGAYAITDIKEFSAYHGEWSRQQDRIVFASSGRIGIIEIPEG